MFNLKIFISVLCFSCFSQAYIFETCTSNNDSKIVETLDGKVKGECYRVPVSYSNNSKIESEVFTWLGIPFAEPPVNNLRFKNPEPVKKWLETKNATTWPKSCIQTVTKFITKDSMSEDCLYLNVFVKSETYLNKDNKLKPMLVYIHGGGFIQGSSANDLWEPSTLVATSDVIVVTINYRLNVFGFLHLADSEATGNAGFLDQNLAIKWVYNNAHLFGGDNNKITISGESSGAFSVGYHLFYQKSWPFFRNAIMESGGPVGTMNAYQLLSSEAVTASTRMLFDELGCNQTRTSEALECALDCNEVDILAANSKLGYRVTFRLVLDNVVFKETIEDSVASRSFKDCNIITGFNSDEYGFFLSTNPMIPINIAKTMTYDQLRTNLFYLWLPNPATAELVADILNAYQVTNTPRPTFVNYLIQIQSDVLFVCQSFRMSEKFSESKNKVFMYKYEYRISSSPYDEIYGTAVHTDDLGVVFGESLSNKIPPLISEDNPYTATKHNYTSDTKLFTQKMIRYWTNFIKYNDPSYKMDKNDPEFWKPFINESTDLNKMSAQEKMATGRYLHITNNNISMTRGFASHKCDFWSYTLDSSN